MTEHNRGKGTDLSLAIYGGIFSVDNSGTSPGVELLNFIYGATEDQMLDPALDPSPEKFGHNFARKLAHPKELDQGREADKQKLKETLHGNEAREVLGVLFASLQIQPPNVKNTTDPGWTRKPFFPFTQSLIHWDIKKSNEKIERVWMRGGGSLLHKILRKDPDSDRLAKIRVGFIDLYKNVESSSLERLARFFRDHQSDKVSSSSPDEIERQSRANLDSFEDVYRDGVLNILTHHNLASVAKIETLVNWSGLWLALMQYRRSCAALGYETIPSLVCDCALTASPLRRLARMQFKFAFNSIKQALDTNPGGNFGHLEQRAKDGVRGFFTSTASALGVLNAYTGNRYLTLKVNALETLVAALVPDQDEMPFEEFIDSCLYGKVGIVVSRSAADRAGLLEEHDATMFEENEVGLAIQMKAAGLLMAFSDATQMVGIKR